MGELAIGGIASIAPLPRLREEAVLIPIPLHWRRERWRSFNQSALIAERISVLTRIPMVKLLNRPQQTYTQSKLPKDLRGQNLVNAFSLNDRLPDKKWFIIVDDVCTSGQTLEAAGKKLKKAGSGEIWGLTIARG